MAAIPHISAKNHHGSLFHHGAAASQHEKLVKQSQKLVSQTFFGTILKQIHNSPFKSELLDGGHGSQGFTTMLDQHLADRMAGHTGMSLVNSMVRKIEKGAAKNHRQSPEKKPSLQRRFQQSGYLKPAGANRGGRQNVPTSLRA
ncbi:MAG TPA: rod-binding protein [Tepidisphaeraceae bacterium]|jgi:Rod binding domain-containing protein|nr:rod-binding protein [Tepidisphaeraceae bacterium]